MVLTIKKRKGKSNHHMPARCGWMSKETYVNNLKSPVFKTQGVKPILCPRCKTGYLIIKKGIHGEFWGCKAYPKCKFTKGL
jgi:ssDNA-binding Zn-finger/Zn-ribbon topoisomerase 1